MLAKSASFNCNCPTAAEPPSLTKSVSLISLTQTLTHSASPSSGSQILFGSFWRGLRTPIIMVFNPCRFGLPLTFILLSLFFGSVLEYSTMYEIPVPPSSTIAFLSFFKLMRSSKTISISLVAGHMSSAPFSYHSETSIGSSYS